MTLPGERTPPPRAPRHRAIGVAVCGADDALFPEERDALRRHVGQHQSEHSLDVGALADRQHHVELLPAPGRLLSGALAAHPVDLDRPPAERAPQQRLRDLHREDASGRKGLGHGREKTVGDPHTVRGRRDRVAEGLRDLRPGDTDHGDDHGHAHAEAHPEDHDAAVGDAVGQHADQRTAHRDSEDRSEEHEPEQARDQLRSHEPAGRDLDDALRDHVGEIDTGDEIVHPRVHRSDQLRPSGRRCGRCRARVPCGIARRACPGSQAQDVGAHGLGPRRRKVLELDVRVVAGADDLELGESDDASGERTGQVDALHAVERRAAVRTEDDALADLDMVSGDPELLEAPDEPEDQHQHDHEPQHAEQRDEDQVVREHPVDGVGAAVVAVVRLFGREQRHGPGDEPVPHVRDDDTRDDDQRQPALEERGERVHPVPLAVRERLGGLPADGCLSARRERGLLLAHRPVRRVSATWMSVSRSASAASWVRPGICTPVVAAAVTILSWAMPNARSSGPCVMSTNCMRP